MSFFLYAFSLGTLFPRLGDLQTQMYIDKATLGFALIGLPLGVQLTLLFADRIVRKFNFRLILTIGIPLLSISQCFAALMLSPYLFAGILIIGGASIAVIEVAVNLEADRVETSIGKRIMNRSHAYWSFGFFGAGIIGAGFSQFGISPFLHFVAITFFISIITNLLFLDYLELIFNRTVGNTAILIKDLSVGIENFYCSFIEDISNSKRNNRAVIVACVYGITILKVKSSYIVDKCVYFI